MHLVHSGMPWGINMSERIFYSAKTNGFYPYSLVEDYTRAGAWPEDAVEITERWYSSLLVGQSAGKMITANEYGQPVMSEPTPPTAQELKVVAESKKYELMREAGEAIAILQDAADLGISTDEEDASLLALRNYRVLLSRVDSDNPIWPEKP